MRKFLLLLLLIFTTLTFAQDLLSRQAPIDRKMKNVESNILQEVEVDSVEAVYLVETPILEDNTEGWEWIKKGRT